MAAGFFFNFCPAATHPSHGYTHSRRYCAFAFVLALWCWDHFLLLVTKPRLLEGRGLNIRTTEWLGYGLISKGLHEKRSYF